MVGLDELAARGRKRLTDDADLVRRSVDAIRPEQLATLIYTSGTTGRPKGVRLTQDCWVYEGVAVNALELLTPDDVQYLWLPLAHAFGKVLLDGPAGDPASAAAVDGRVDRIIDNLAIVSPTFMAAVPRIFEKVYGRVVTMAAEEGGARKKIFDWAIGVGREHSKVTLAGGTPGATPQGSSTPWPTGWCSPSCARGSGASCGSSSAAAPRCRRTSPSSSTPPAS